MRHELYIDTGDALATVAIFEAFRQRRAEFEAAYGRKLRWEDLPDRRACRIADYYPRHASVTDESAHAEYVDWFMDAGERLRRALAAMNHPPLAPARATPSNEATAPAVAREPPMPAVQNRVLQDETGSPERSEPDAAAGRPRPDNRLAPFAQSIETAHRRLGHELGWTFLYTPAGTLAPGTRLAFVPLNPGVGMYHDRIKLSYEEGSAYRTEPWGPRRTLSKLQIQICLLYDLLAERVAGTTAEELMDDTLALNFCPFRSSSWDTLVNRDASIKFSQSMWAKILEIVQPAVIVCLGDAPAQYLDPVLRAQGAAPTGLEERHGAGWGTVTYGLRRYVTARDELTMVRLPHLSRFTIFGRPESHHATSVIADTISTALR